VPHNIAHAITIRPQRSKKSPRCSFDLIADYVCQCHLDGLDAFALDPADILVLNE